MLINILGLGFALSVDGAGIGLSFGIRGITINKKSLATIFFISLVIAFAALMIGKGLLLLIPNFMIGFVGGGALIIMGLLTIIKNFTEAPQAFDKDSSNVIEPKEAISLALVLSVDSLGAGMAAASLSVNPALMVLTIAIFQTLFLGTGIIIGKFFRGHGEKIGEHWIWGLMSGILLTLIGLGRIIV